MTREEALVLLKKGKRMTNSKWNWLTKQNMFVAVQTPDDNSFMTEPYLYMQIEKNNEDVWVDITRVPRSPSRLDMFSDDWAQFFE